MCSRFVVSFTRLFCVWVGRRGEIHLLLEVGEGGWERCVVFPLDINYKIVLDDLVFLTRAIIIQITRPLKRRKFLGEITDDFGNVS